MENAEICLFYFSCIELLPPQYWGVIFVLVAVPIPFFRDFSKNDTYAIIFLVNFFLTKINEKLISFFATPRPLPPLTGGGLHPPSYKNGGQNTSYGPLFLFQKGVSLSPRLFPIISLNPYQRVNFGRYFLKGETSFTKLILPLGFHRPLRIPYKSLSGYKDPEQKRVHLFDAPVG